MTEASPRTSAQDDRYTAVRGAGQWGLGGSGAVRGGCSPQAADCGANSSPRGLSEWVGRSFAGVQPIPLRRCKWRLEQKRRLLKAPEHLGDEMHAIAEISPVEGSRLLRAVTRRIDPIKEIAELGQDDLSK